jgi:serpin B
LKIDDVGQFTFIAVDEEGTEAAAVTGLSIIPISLSVRRAGFRADRPFIYLIEDRTSGAVLFIGRVVDPR